MDTNNAGLKQLITILGPTACGKTAITTRLAERVGGEIISADSRQVYRRMDIGTGKDLADYELAGKRIPYHLIDICEPGTKYNLFQYQQDFTAAYDDIRRRGRQPILCGGTGLYIESVLKGYRLSPVPQNPALRDELSGKSLEELTEILKDLKRRTGSVMHNKTDIDTAQRAIRAIEIEVARENSMSAIPAVSSCNRLVDRDLESVVEEQEGLPSLIIGVNIDRELRRKKITKRLKARLDEGMIDEVRGLLEEGISPDDLIYYGLEYKYLTLHCIGKLSFDEMFRQLEIAIHQFAKRQMTWFRGMERRGFHINWIDAPQSEEEMEHCLKEILELRDRALTLR